MEPPARSPFSWTTTFAPSSPARAAATRPAIPAPATTRSGSVLDEGEGRLVLDVLELDAVRPPHEDGIRVRRVHDVGDLEPSLLGLPDVVVRGLDTQPKVIEQRPLGLRGLACLEIDVGVTGLEAAVLHDEAQLG